MLLSLFPHLCFKVALCSPCSESHILCFKVAPCFSYSESHKLYFFCSAPFHHCQPPLCRATFAGTIHPPYTFLKIATIPTYYGISIAITRYIAMQLSTIPFIIIMTYFTFVILPLHDHVVDIIFVAKPPCIIFYTCHS